MQIPPVRDEVHAAEIVNSMSADHRRQLVAALKKMYPTVKTTKEMQVLLEKFCKING